MKSIIDLSPDILHLECICYTICRHILQQIWRYCEPTGQGQCLILYSISFRASRLCLMRERRRDPTPHPTFTGQKPLKRMEGHGCGCCEQRQSGIPAQKMDAAGCEYFMCRPRSGYERGSVALESQNVYFSQTQGKSSQASFWVCEGFSNKLEKLY